MSASDALTTGLQALLAQHALPASYLNAIDPFLLPIAEHLTLRRKQTEKALIWGVCGSQGSGKTTLVQFLQCLLHLKFGLSSICLSLDDFYHSREQRQLLARIWHPLFATRGVPGTHDSRAGIQLLTQLKHSGPATSPLALPRFDKSCDDPLPVAGWPVLQTAPDIVLFEGWCVGTPAQPEGMLQQPVNALEADEDPHGIWRRTVNTHLQTDYAQWWRLLDGLLFIQAPGFEQVMEWRQLQEEKLRDSYLQRGAAVPPQVMSAMQIERFIQHYERLTRWNLACLPASSDLVLELQVNHQFRALRSNP
jgi:D-glycerate 3-kinase